MNETERVLLRQAIHQPRALNDFLARVRLEAGG
jgi:hypothetical protein